MGTTPALARLSLDPQTRIPDHHRAHLLPLMSFRWSSIQGERHGGSGTAVRRRAQKQQEHGIMAQLLIVCTLRPGTQERWRRLYQELAASRRAQFEASCRQAGISQVQIWLVQLRRGELLLMRLHVQQSRQVLLELAQSERPFERWLRRQLQGLLGWNVQEVLPEQQQELIFAWSDESFGS